MSQNSVRNPFSVVFSRLAKYVLSVVSIRLETNKKILTRQIFQKYYGSKFAKLSSINVFYFVSSYPTPDNLVFTTYTIFTMPKERSNWIKIRPLLYEKKHLLKVFLFIWKFLLLLIRAWSE